MPNLISDSTASRLRALLGQRPPAPSSRPAPTVLLPAASSAADALHPFRIRWSASESHFQVYLPPLSLIDGGTGGNISPSTSPVAGTDWHNITTGMSIPATAHILITVDPSDATFSWLVEGNATPSATQVAIPIAQVAAAPSGGYVIHQLIRSSILFPAPCMSLRPNCVVDVAWDAANHRLTVTRGIGCAGLVQSPTTLLGFEPYQPAT